MAIDLTCVQDALTEAMELVQNLDGLDLDEADALTSQSKGTARQEKAARSQDLNRLADLCTVAEVLARNEYWKSRGRPDPLANYSTAKP